MSVLVDLHEDPLYDTYLHGHVPFIRGPYNQTDRTGPVYPDFTIINGGMIPGLNAKQAGELVGNIDACEEQLTREIPYVDKLTLMVRGLITPTTDNCCLCRPVDEKGHIQNGRIFAQNYVGLMAWFHRIEEMGVAVVQLPNIRACASYIIAMHNNVGKPEHHTFTRLIKLKQMIDEQDPNERAWLLRLMSIPGVAEQAARAIAAVIPNDYQLVMFLAEGGKLADLVLPSGRKLGPALEKRIRGFLGVRACAQKFA